MADLLGIGVSGLTVAQGALSTTGHNISNVNTEGYSRQRVEITNREPQRTGGGFFGQGSMINSVTRYYDKFLSEQVRTHLSLSNQNDVFFELASQVDNILAETEVGLTPSMEEFFKAVQEVANDPSSIPARQLMMTTGESLVDRFHYLDQRFDELQDRANRQLETVVSEVNELAASIAKLNKDIAFQSAGFNQPPNDLLDQRDTLIDELSKLVKVTTVEDSNNVLNIFVGSGQGMVIGSSSSTLAVTNHEFDPAQREITIDTGSGPSTVTNFLSGGELEGTLTFVNGVLKPAQNSLGRIAIGFAEEFNAQHRLGVDLLNNLGGDFFSAPIPQVLNSSTNTGVAVPSAIVSSVSSLTTDDYLLEYNGANWSITNINTNAVVNPVPANPFTYDGLDITLPVAGVNAGDRFLLRPTSDAAQDVGMTLNDPSRIAAAGVFTGQVATNVSGIPTNLGTGSIREVTTADPNRLQFGVGQDITLNFNSATNEYTIATNLPVGWTAVGIPANPLPYNPATDDGNPYTIRVDDGGGTTFDITLRLFGTPANGDQMIISDNRDAVSDNSNALLLGDMATSNRLVNGTVSFQGSYAQLVAEVGTRTHQAEINSNAEATLLRQANEAKSGLAGVNLDEEAANLIKFQQYYQANAQVISAAKLLFDTLLNAVR